MSGELDESVMQAVAVGNFKAIAEQPAMLANLAYSNVVANTNSSAQNAVANQQGVNELGVAVVGKTVNNVSNIGPLEARCAVDVLTNDEVSQSIVDLKGAVEAFSGGATGAPGSQTNPFPPNQRVFVSEKDWRSGDIFHVHVLGVTPSELAVPTPRVEGDSTVFDIRKR